MHESTSINPPTQRWIGKVAALAKGSISAPFCALDG